MCPLQVSSSLSQTNANPVYIMASKEGEALKLFNAKGAKTQALHLAKMCQQADLERRFLNEADLDSLFREPDIASGMRRLLTRFEAEFPAVFPKIDADLNEIHPDRSSQLAPEEWQRWGQLVQYILLSARGDEHDNNDLQGIVDTVEALVDR